MAELQLRAAQKAQAVLAYRTALRFLAAGMALLPPDPWTSDLSLTSALHFACGACELLSANAEAARRMLEPVLNRAPSPIDRAEAARLLSSASVIQGDIAHAIAVALAGLRELGVGLSMTPNHADLEMAHRLYRMLLADRDIHALLDLPEMTDPAMLAAMRLLDGLYLVTREWDKHLWGLIPMQMAILSLRHGNAPESVIGYARFGLALNIYFQEYHEGYRLGELARDLMLRRNQRADRGRVLAMLQMLGFWIQPMESTCDARREAFESLRELGEPLKAAQSLVNLIYEMILVGLPLKQIVTESDSALAFQAQARHTVAADTTRCMRQMAQMLRGQTASWGSFDDSTFSEAEFEARLTSQQGATVRCRYYLFKLQAAVYTGEAARAHVAAIELRPLSWIMADVELMHDYVYFHALALAALVDSTSGEERETYFAALRRHEHQLAIWARYNPATFGCTHALVSAEVTRIDGDDMAAMRLYDQSIARAIASGFPQHEALANERAAAFYRERHFATIADTYLRNTRGAYERWGADGKVLQLESQFPQLRRLAHPDSTSATSSAQLDTLAVAKAAQAISSQIVRDQLLQTLLTVVLEQAGAQHGALLLSDGDELLLAATAHVEAQHIQVRLLPQERFIAAVLPASIMAYVRRTHQRVLLDDAQVTHPFSGDLYLVAQQPRAILAQPILRQGTLIGIVYLEHRAITHVFTIERLIVLEQLAAQAAISLENAQLYATLEQKVADRTADLNTALTEVRGANVRLEGLLNFARFLQHEVRGYAAGLEGLTPLLRKGFVGHPESAHYDVRLDALEDTVAQMNDLTQRMLILTREGALPLQQRQAMLLLPILEQTRTNGLAFAENLDFSLAITLACPAEITVPGDPLYLTLAIYTGLRNAIEVLAAQDRDDAEIQIGIRDTGSQIRLSDNGPGFPAALLDAVTLARRNVGGFVIGWSSKQGGSGLGLALMDRVAQLHGGSLTIGNRDDRPGAWVELALPRSEG